MTKWWCHYGPGTGRFVPCLFMLCKPQLALFLLQCSDVALCAFSAVFTMICFCFVSARSSILCNMLLCLCKSNSQQEEAEKKHLLLCTYLIFSHKHTHAILTILYTTGCIVNYSDCFVPAWMAVSSLYRLYTLNVRWMARLPHSMYNNSTVTCIIYKVLWTSCLSRYEAGCCTRETALSNQCYVWWQIHDCLCRNV